MKRAILLSVIFCSAVTMVVSQPSFVWAGRMGGTASSSAPSDVGRGIALDKSGNVYTIGNFWGNADMNPGPGTFYLNSAGVSDVFLSKLDSAGDFVWAKKFGGTNYNDGNDIAIDDSGYIYITGSFLSATDFDPGSGVVMLTPLGYRDVFVCKLDADGNLIWAKQFGGEAIVTDQVDGTGIAVDAQGNVYTTGAIWYGKADFDPGPAVYNLSTAGDFDIFICKLNRNGDFEWAHRMGGTKRDLGSKIAVDRNGYAYLTGYFTGTVDFDPGVAVRNLSTSQFYKDIFICRFDSTGALSWANQIGVLNGDDVGQDIAVDASGNVYTTGNFYYGGADFDPGIDTFNLNSQSSTDVFICKWDSSANFLWARDIGGPSMVIKGFSIGVAGSSVCVTGHFGGAAGGTVDFDPGLGVYNLVCNQGTSSNSVNIYALQLDTAGVFVCAGQMGGPTGIVTNTGFAIAADNVGNMYLTGQYVSTADFDPDSVGTYYLTTTNSLDDEEIFVCKLHGPVFVSQLPHADFSASDTAFCTTGCIDFSNQSSASISWHWEFPGADRLTDTNQTPQNVCYSVSGIYDVILIARNSFGADTLRKVNYISVYSPDSASILVPHLDTLMCSGDSIQLCSSGNFLSYIWNTGDTSTCIQAKTAGAYWLTTTDANGCSASSDRQEVSVYPVPTVSVSVNRDTLSSFSAVSYQWYFNGNLLSGANAQTYIAKATGYYAVAIVDSNGCRATSSEVPFAITAINELDESVNIYPNPSSINNVQLSITNNLVGSSMEVYDVNGRIVFVSKLMAQSSQFDLPLSKGVYFIRILSERASVVKRFVRL